MLLFKIKFYTFKLFYYTYQYKYIIIITYAIYSRKL